MPPLPTTNHIAASPKPPAEINTAGSGVIPSRPRQVGVAAPPASAKVYSREPERWSLQVLGPPDVVALPAIGAELTFDEIYEDSGR
jgi:hypothetical protein